MDDGVMAVFRHSTVPLLAFGADDLRALLDGDIINLEKYWQRLCSDHISNHICRR